jgi:hypothetical protein
MAPHIQAHSHDTQSWHSVFKHAIMAHRTEARSIGTAYSSTQSWHTIFKHAAITHQRQKTQLTQHELDLWRGLHPQPVWKRKPPEMHGQPHELYTLTSEAHLCAAVLVRIPTGRSAVTCISACHSRAARYTFHDGIGVTQIRVGWIRVVRIKVTRIRVTQIRVGGSAARG